MRWAVDRLAGIEEACIARVPASRLRQARAAVRFAAGTSPWGLVFSVVFAALGETLLAASLGLAGIGVGLLPVVLCRTGSVDLAAHWANAMLAQSLVVSAWLLGGLLAASVPWLALCIVFATFLSGPRAGLVWAVVGSVVVLGLLVSHRAGAVSPAVVPPEVVWGLATLAHVGLFAVVLVMVAAADGVTARARADLEQARAAADEANQAKSAFLARTSHELRTPMNAVIGYAELLLEEPDSGGREELERIRTAGLHLLALVNDVLDLSKVDAGAMPFTCGPVDAAAVARAVLVTTDPLLVRGGNRSAVRARGASRVWADARRLEQCLLNLVANAARFTRDGEVVIEIAPSADATEIVVAVRDSGSGIPREHLGRIFEPFVQVHPGDAGGTGLGLVLVRQFVEQMGGRVWVESEEGVGSVFSITVPVAPPTGDRGPG